MFRNIIIVSVLMAVLASCIGGRSDKADRENKDMKRDGIYLLVGTYTSPEGSKGIYLYHFDSDSGRSDSISMVEVDNPSFLTLSPDEKFIYAVSENDVPNSAVHAFSFDKQRGEMVLLNSQPINSDSPCYITVDDNGRNVHTANYGGGSVASFQVQGDGSLSPIVSMITFKGSGPDSVRQNSAHLHSVQFSPDGQYLFATDLGSDKLYRFDVNNTPFEGQPGLLENSLKEFQMPEGTGPRHFTFHPDGGKYLYLLGELSGKVLVFDYDFGELKQKQEIVADTVGARGSADIHVSPDGRFLYASNRLEADGIAIFSINPKDGTLTKVGYQLTGKHPRNFAITPDGKFLLVASRDENKIQVYSIDSDTGLLTDTRQDIMLSKPVCLQFASNELN